jgi:pantothenate kinase type III
VTGVLGALAGTTADAEPAAAQRATDADVASVVRSLDQIRSSIQNERQFTEIAIVREAQKTFLRTNGKLPDFIEVGADIWFAAYDWHVRWQQPLNIGRDASGRYTLLLVQTLLILRPELQANYVSLPYDAR